jgi:hypothetical protein
MRVRGVVPLLCTRLLEDVIFNINSVVTIESTSLVTKRPRERDFANMGLGVHFQNQPHLLYSRATCREVWEDQVAPCEDRLMFDVCSKLDIRSVPNRFCTCYLDVSSAITNRRFVLGDSLRKRFAPDDSGSILWRTG